MCVSFDEVIAHTGLSPSTHVNAFRAFSNRDECDISQDDDFACSMAHQHLTLALSFASQVELCLIVCMQHQRSRPTTPQLHVQPRPLRRSRAHHGRRLAAVEQAMYPSHSAIATMITKRPIPLQLLCYLIFSHGVQLARCIHQLHACRPLRI